MSKALSNPLKEAIASAARWQALLQSSDVSDADRRNWECWLEKDPVHREAWLAIEKLQASLSDVPKSLAGTALRGADASRRDVLRRLTLIAVAAPVAVLSWRYVPWQRWQADYTTAIGQQRSVVLPDGSKLVLNTASALDMEFSQSQRLLRLYKGEILVQTAADRQTPARSFFVQTPQGRIEALGTQFTVRVTEDVSHVNVLKAAVRIYPQSGGSSSNLRQGTQTYFNKGAVGKQHPSDAYTSSWISGSLVVVDMPLAELLEELSRYRQGFLSCDDSIAKMNISGAFPLDDTERALSAITTAFSVKEIRLTRYWVKLVPA